MMISNVTCFVLVACGLALCGCKKTEYSSFMKSKKAYKVNRPMFDLRAVRLSDSTVQFSFMTPSTLRTTDRSIRYVDLFVAATPNGKKDSIMVSPSVAGTPGVDETIYFIGEGVWDSPIAKSSRQAFVDVNVVTYSDHIVFSDTIEYTKAEPMELLPFAQHGKESLVELGVTARRIFVPQGEYLPTSEAFRVIISDAKGNVVWRSDAGMAFLTVVGDVQPQSSNAVHRYIMPWNAKDLSGQAVPDGEYRVDMIIPARPTPYTSVLTLEWPLR